MLVFLGGDAGIARRLDRLGGCADFAEVVLGKAGKDSHGRYSGPPSHRRIDDEFQRRIVVGLKACMLEGEPALLGMF